MNDSDCIAYGHARLTGLWECLSGDISRYVTKSHDYKFRGSLKQRLSALLTPELLCLAVYRVSHFLYARGWHRLASFSSTVNTLLHKVSITPQSCIGPGCRLPHPGALTFHGRAGKGLTLYSLAICCANSETLDGPVELGPNFGDRVTVGGHSVLLGPMKVGDDTKIGFAVNLSVDIPPNSFVVSRVRRIRPNAGQPQPMVSR